MHWDDDRNSLAGVARYRSAQWCVRTPSTHGQSQLSATDPVAIGTGHLSEKQDPWPQAAEGGVSTGGHQTDGSCIRRFWPSHLIVNCTTFVSNF